VENGQDMPSTTRCNRRDQHCTRAAAPRDATAMRWLRFHWGLEPDMVRRGNETEPRSPVLFRKLLFSCAMLMVASLAILTPASPASAQEQTYPDHPVRIIVPIGAGGAYDIIGRLLANKLTEQIGQTFFVENRTGAGTLVGTQAAAAAPAD